MRVLWLLCAIASLCIFACDNGGSDGDGDVDGDADGDGDGDGDGDADGDSSVDPGAPGSACSCDGECAARGGHEAVCVYGVCMTRPSDSCSEPGSTAECAEGSRCWPLQGFYRSVCWPDCASHDCAGWCDEEGSCRPGSAVRCDPTCATYCGVGDGVIGSSCERLDDCLRGECYDGEGWIDNYCLMFDCSPAGGLCGDQGLCVDDLFSDGTRSYDTCMEGCNGKCRPGYACRELDGAVFCIAGCEANDDGTSSCPRGYRCEDIDSDPEVERFRCLEHCEGDDDCDGGFLCDLSTNECVERPCESDDECDGDWVCTAGRCWPDIGEGPGPAPGPSCPDLPPLECDGTSTYCGELIQFDPTNDPSEAGYDPMLGYIDYPENGESWSDQYRSWLRREAVLAIQYATAYVACMTAGWELGNGEPLGMIDMSEEDGSIPGTREGDPGHPSGTHVYGHDIDVAYYQEGMSDNMARPVCDHMAPTGGDAGHCTAPPHLLDPWRTAMFIAALAQHSALRIIGADGQAGPMISYAWDVLCEEGWIDEPTCHAFPLTWEEENEGRGWFYSHHHHMHVSFD